MKTTIKQNGLVEITVENKANALHLIGSDSYIAGGKATVKATDVEKWEECPIPPYTKDEYDAKVAEFVRQRYTADEEFALQRKAINAAFSPSTTNADAKAMQEYSAYNSYVEQCYEMAKDPEVYKNNIEHLTHDNDGQA